MKSAVLMLLIVAPALAACGKEAGSDDIVAALRACGIENAKVERRVPDGTQSDFQVDFGVTESGQELSDCMNAHIRASGLKPVLTFSEKPG